MAKGLPIITLNTAVVFLTCCGAAPPREADFAESDVGTEPIAEAEVAGVQASVDAGNGGIGIGSVGGIGIADASSCPCGICPDGSHEFAEGVPFPDDFDTTVEEPGLEDFLKALTSGDIEIESAVHWPAVKQLLAAARIESGGSEFNKDKRLRSLKLALGAVPGGCIPRFEVGGGYEMMAFPPATTDNTDEESAIIDAAIDYLQTGNEVSVTCMYHVEDPDWDEETGDEPKPIQEPRPALILNVMKDSNGEWKVVAWAAMRGALNGVYPD